MLIPTDKEIQSERRRSLRRARSQQRIVRRRRKSMTMPHLMNCEHAESGWCLACVRKLHDELEETRAILNEKCGNEQWFDEMNKARIQQSLPKEYLEAIAAAAKSSNAELTGAKRPVQ